jgi:hypothetical protein
MRPKKYFKKHASTKAKRIFKRPKGENNREKTVLSAEDWPGSRHRAGDMELKFRRLRRWNGKKKAKEWRDRVVQHARNMALEREAMKKLYEEVPPVPKIEGKDYNEVVGDIMKAIEQLDITNDKGEQNDDEDDVPEPEEVN